MHKNKETYKIAIIGGSGIDKFEDCEMVGEISIDTPFGKTSDKIKILTKIEPQTLSISCLAQI